MCSLSYSLLRGCLFKQQANIDAYKVQLKHEQDKRTEAQTKLSQMKVNIVSMS